MISVIRTNSEHPNFVELVDLLDADLAIRDGQDHSFYAPFNTITKIKHAVVAYDNGRPVGCGAIKEFDPLSMEIKRMYVRPKERGQGIAAKVLSALEAWARELGCSRCVLETGKKQPEAIALYHRSGYKRIENYGQYAGIENSLCFEKQL